MLNPIWMAVMPTLALSFPPADQQPAAVADQPATGFLYKTLRIDRQTYAYCVFVPPEYTPEKPWPVILFLHGSGERGTDGFLQTEVGVGTAIRRNHRRIPAIVVMPQCRPNQSWDGPMRSMALRCLEATSRQYHLDPARVYLTGLSLGGQGVWHIAAAFPGRFAAIVPIASFAELGEPTGLAARLAPRLRRVPIWCFHGELDANVPVVKSREMVAAIRNAGGTVHYTEYKGAKHFIWDRAYGDPALWKWLFAQRRGTAKTNGEEP